MTATYTMAQATTILRNLGFRVRTSGEFRQQLASFQGGFNLGTWLSTDGVLGPRTSVALGKADANRRSGRPTASPHFSFSEFRCTCGGTYGNCRGVLVRRELLASLEKYRARVGSVSIVSGYRCPSRNKAVGGASSSQHMYGTAADVGYRLSDTQVRALKAFTGIGRSGSTRMVRHVDRRDCGHNLTGGSLAHPTTWNYAS